MGALENKVAIVTGASSGIGYAAAKLFAIEGARVVVAARRQHELDKLVEQVKSNGGIAIALAGDVQDEDYAIALVDTAKREFGGLDIAFNNAGTLGEMGPSTEVSLQGWQQTLATNLTGAFLCAKFQIAAMLERGAGSIIFTSTFVGYTTGLPRMAAYAASKAGLIGLTKVLAAEYGGNGIRVNALLPGGVDTPLGASVAHTAEARAYVEGLHALKRIAAPDEIARAALFLASDAASFVTGAAFLADGGVSVYRA